MRNKKLALFLTLAMIISMFPLNAFGTEFSDMPDNWSTKALESAVANGLLKGDNGRIMPNENLTRAQMATIVNRAFGTREKTSIDKFTDVKKDAWYFDEMSKAVQMKTFIGSGDKLYPDNSISREEAFIVLARAFKLSGGNANILDKFTDKNDISDWAREGISSLVAAGYISGSDGRINPKHNITRAEFAQVMYNLLKNYINKEGTYTEDYDGNLMINVPNVTLKGLTVTGDLIIGDGVGDGEVILDDVTVTGRVLVRGGGENSIKIIGNSNINNIIIARVDGKVRIYAEDGTEVGEVIADGYDDVIIEGNFESVTIVGTDITVTATNATVESASIEGENSKIIIDEKSSVKTINVNANNAEISGKGTVESVIANANNVEVKVPGASVTAGEGTTGVTAGDKPVEPGKTETVPKEETTSSGGGTTTPKVSAISVDKTRIALTVGDTETITATVSPANASDKRLTWSSDNEEVATVDENGVVTGIKGGTATITVASAAKSSIRATVKVIVGDVLVTAGESIKNAINAANEGDVILVGPGTYKESLTIGKSVTLCSTKGAAETTLDGDHASDNYYMVNIKADNVTIDGFTITNPKYNSTADASGIVIGSAGRNSNIRVTNCVIHDIGTSDRKNVSFGTFGFNVGPVNNLEIDNCHIFNIKNGDGNSRAIGIFTWGNNANDTVANASIHDNIIENIDNPGTMVYGISTGYYGTDITVSDNTINNVKNGIRVNSYMLGPVSVTGNTVKFSMTSGIRLDGGQSQTVTGNNISESAIGVLLTETCSETGPQISGNTFEKNAVHVQDNRTVAPANYLAGLLPNNTFPEDSAVVGNKIKVPDWADYADTSWYNDNPSAASFTIDTAEELAGLSKLVNENKIKFDGKTIFLGADIDLNNLEWVPIGSYYGTWFGGVFDGNGKTISGIKVSDNTIPEVGLFGYVRGSSDEAGIQNLTVSGRIDIYDNNTIKPISANNHTSEAGLLAAYVWGFVDNCHTTDVKTDNTVAFRSIYTGDRYRASIGGLVGTISMGNITDSSFTGTVYGETDVTVADTNSGAFIGGLVGLANGGSVLDCDIDADVTGNTYRYLSLGGAIGYIMSNGRQYSNINYQGAVYGNVNITEKQCQTSTVEAGGLIGAGEFGLNTQIHNNTSEGILLGNAAADDYANVSVGGIIGEAYFKNTLTSYSLKNNVVDLEISVEQTADAVINVGGLVGTMYNASASADPSLVITFDKCQVGGSISVKSSVRGSDRECYVGGLLGSGIKLVDGTFVMTDCTSVTPNVSVDSSAKSAGDYWGRNDWAPVYIEGTEDVFYSTIQAAIDASQEGDTIMVGPGTYNLTEALTLGKPITIIGAGADKTIIDASGFSSGYAFPLTNNADLSVQNITFKGKSDVTGFRASSQTHVVNLEFINCVFENFKYPIYLSERTIEQGAEDKDNKVDNLTIKDCTFNNLNHVYIGRGVVNSALVEGNTFAGTNQIGIEFYDCWTSRRTGSISFENNSFTNEYPIVLLTGGPVTIKNTSITYNETPGGRIIVAYVKAAQEENEKVLIENTEINGLIRDLVQQEVWWGEVVYHCYIVPNEENGAGMENLGTFNIAPEELDEEIPADEEELDLTPLEKAIEAAIAAKEGVVVSVDGTDLPAGTYWVTQADMDALDAAITKAEAAREAAETHEDVDDAAAELEAAIAAFNDVKREAVDEEEIGEAGQGEELEE